MEGSGTRLAFVLAFALALASTLALAFPMPYSIGLGLGYPSGEILYGDLADFKEHLTPFQEYEICSLFFIRTIGF